MNQEDVYWISYEDTLAIHDEQVLPENGGGDDGIRDDGLIRSALAKPQNLMSYGSSKPTIAELAATYCYGLIKNHGFIDGNKRTGLVVFVTFVRKNGCYYHADRQDEESMVLGVSKGYNSQEELSSWIRETLLQSKF